jgi:hypothetical protein
MWKRHCAVPGIICATQCSSMIYAAVLTVSVVATDPTATIGTTDPAAFTFTRDGSTSASLPVNFSLGGSAVKWNDYRRLPEGDMPVSITIPTGATSATLTIYAVANSTLANPETVSLALLPDAAYTVGSQNNAVVTIQSSSGTTNPPASTNSPPATTNSTAGVIDDTALALPKVGDNSLRILSPTLLELRAINTKQPDPATVTNWNLVNASGQLVVPSLSAFSVTVNGQAAVVQSVGFKRRPLYAPLANYDLRIENCLYLQLGTPIPNSATVVVTNPGNALWPATLQFTATADPLRYSPAIHVNQEGYMPSCPKKGIVGYYTGSLGEMAIPSMSFSLVDAHSGATVFSGTMTQRKDIGYNYTPTPYQNVYEADFTSFTTPGECLLVVPGLGTSLPFLINDGIAMDFARTYELGLFEQRSGYNVAMPFTRFTHAADHTAPASVPTNASSAFAFTWTTISNYAVVANADNPTQTAPRLTSPSAQLYPFVNQGPLDVSGGHFDAGDYSKYTWDCAQFVHTLMFAVDSFPGVASLDNLGIPESGDGISDAMQEAKWEADCLAKLQDADGGFYYVVYPQHGEYEGYVLPENGDSQVVWPKNTAATAAAVAALAECASSPLFKQTYPTVASNYLAKAKLGWSFLTNAIAKHGKNGAYQKLMHFGDDFTDQDDLAWAACEMFLATGDPSCQTTLESWFPDPTYAGTFRWGWWRMFACYGNAVRDYAFAVKSGRLLASQLDANYLAKCIATITNCGNDNLKWSQENAYGSSFPNATKNVRGAGWYYSPAQAFDIVVAYQFNPNPAYLDAILRNLNYEGGCNPVNVTYVTGLGWKRQREIVDQYSQNDRHLLPKDGIPIGNIQQGFVFVNTYGSELTGLCFPSDNASTAPYPYYDRWGDAFNVTTEASSDDTVRSFVGMAWLAAQTSLKTQSWTFATAPISAPASVVPVGQPVTISLQSGLDLNGARIVWEGRDQEPAYGSTFTFVPKNNGAQWVEAEVQWPDGRRVFATANFTANSPNVVWVEDAVPVGGAPSSSGGDAWNWTSSNPAQYSGASAHQSASAAGLHEHWFDNATAALDISTGDTLYSYVYLDPSNPPSEVMLQWNNGSWEHRAYWGANNITYGIGGTPSRAYMGPLPASGQWVRLQVPASQVGLEGSTLKGMGFSAYGGRVTWDCAGKTSPVSTSETNVLVITNSVVSSISRVSGGTMQFTWPSVAGKIYRIAYKNALTDANWTDLGVNVTATGTNASWTDATAAAASKRFYLVYVTN